MLASLRKVLIDSNVAAIAILVLVCWSLAAALWAVWGPVGKLFLFLTTAVAIRDIPYISPQVTTFDRLMYLDSASFLLTALTNVIAAWLLSRWVYGRGPLNCLRIFRLATLRRVRVSAIEDGTGR